MVKRIAMLEKLLYNFKASLSAPPQRSTQAGSNLEAITYSEPGLSADDQISTIMTALVPGAHSVPQLDSHFAQPPALSLKSPKEFSPLQRVLTLPDHEKVGASNQSTEDDILLLSTGLNSSQSEFFHVVSSSKAISNVSDDEECVIATCERNGLPGMNSLPSQKSLDWTSNTCTSDEGEEGSCIYSGETVRTPGPQILVKLTIYILG